MNCQVCGQPARVKILEGYLSGEPVFRHFCFACAERFHRDMSALETGGPGRRLSYGVLLTLVGFMIVGLGALGDHLGIHGSRGFGWYQLLILGLGLLLMILGALTRVEIMAVMGTLIAGLTACSDLLRLSGAPGVGWKQQTALVLGLVLAAVGILMLLSRDKSFREPRSCH